MDPLIIATCVLAAMTAYVAKRKGRSVVAWLLLGFLLPVLALAAVALLPGQTQTTTAMVASERSAISRTLAFLGKILIGVLLGFMVVFAANGGAGGSSTMSAPAWLALVVYAAFFLRAVVRWARLAYRPGA